MELILQYQMQITLGAVLLIAIMGMILIQRNKKNHINKTVKNKNSRKNSFLYSCYKIIRKIKPLDREYKKEYSRISTLYPSDAISVRNNVVQNMVMSIGIAILVMIFIIITSRGSIFYMGLGLALTYVVYTTIMETKYRNLHTKLLDQFKTFVVDVKNNYYAENRQLDTAIYDTIVDSPYEMSLHAQKFYDILTSQDMMTENNKYIETAPNKFFVLFSAIATITWKYSDVEIPEQKTTNFIRSMNLLKDEVNTELLRVKRNAYLFNGLIWVAILPIFLVKLIELYGTRGITELAPYYEGAFGTVMMVVIFVVSVICYKIVMDMQDTIKHETRYHPMLDRISSIPPVNRLLTALQNRNYSKAEKITEKLKLSGDKMGIKQYYLQRILYAFIGFIGAIIVTIAAIFAQRAYVENNYDEVFEASYEISADKEEAMEDIARRLAKVDGVKNMDREELADTIIEQNPELENRIYATLVADVAIDKNTQLSDLYYKWWFMFIALFGAFVGFQIPALLLKLHVQKTELSMQDEVDQFNTIVMMLMYVDNMNLLTILEWMKRFAYSFEEPISKCIVDFTMDEEKALETLMYQPYPPFKRFVKNMLNVNKQGLVKAFEDVESEKKNSNEERKEDNEERLVKQSDNAKIIAMIPLAVEIGGYMLFPMFMMAAEMIEQITSVM